MCAVSFQITGRELFAFNPDMVGEDDDEAADDTQYHRVNDTEEVSTGGQLHGPAEA